VKALVIGSGGSAHALAWKLSQSPAVNMTYTAPGSYGTNLVGANVNIPVTDPEALAGWATENKIDLTVVASETALCYGAVDLFRERGLKALGPTQAGARLQTSVSWAKEFMDRHHIPTAPHQIFDDLNNATAHFDRLPPTGYPIVIKSDRRKTDGAVTIAEDRHSAIAAAKAALREARRGPPPRIVVENYLQGPNILLMAISDGNTVWPLAPARVYRYAYDGDTGPIAGGIGGYSPVESVDEAAVGRVMDEIIKPALAGLAAEEMSYPGVLSADLVLTSSGPMVLGFDVGFADTATEVVLPRLDNDLYIVVDAVLDGQLAELEPLRWSPDETCGVVLCSEGYPGEFETGYGILGLGDAGSRVEVFHAGTRDPYAKSSDIVSPKLERAPKGGMMRGQGLTGFFLPSRGRSKAADRQAVQISRDPFSQVVTAGGRVITLVGRGRTLDVARDAAYAAAESISFTGCWHRSDIGMRDIGGPAC
jgi:phosphoribosylamine--glycine ligase